MRRYHMKGAKVLYASSDLEFVQKLRKIAFSESESLEDYMGQVASRALIWSGTKISTTDAEDFVSDLLRNGFLLVEYFDEN